VLPIALRIVAKILFSDFFAKKIEAESLTLAVMPK